MKISIISDSHLGHGFGTEVENDSFEQFQEALEKSIVEKVDLILLPGDVFDTRTPKQEVWAKALNIMQKPILAGKSPVKIVSFTKQNQKHSSITLNGIPVIAIHGTHEKRGENQVNPIELLEEAGYLIHLVKDTIVFEKENEKIAITGLSGVPEREIKTILEQWNPKPIENCFNFFVFHQSTKEEIYDKDDTFISVNDLPKGFDLYIDGHIHWRNYMPEKKFLIAGSTVITQQKDKEALQGKGYFIIETNPLKVDFRKIENQRPFFFKSFEFQDADTMKIDNEINGYLKTIPNLSKKPMIKIKLKGKLEKGRTKSQIDLNEFRKNEKFILSIDNELESDDFKKLVSNLRQLHQEKKSVDEMGMDLINKLLKETKYNSINIDKIIEPLADGNIDYVLKMIEENKKEN